MSTHAAIGVVSLLKFRDWVFFSGHASIDVLDSRISSSGRSTHMQIFLFEACRLHVRDESFMHKPRMQSAYC